MKIDYLKVNYLGKIASSYNSYTSNDKNFIFTETFDDNSKDWSEGTTGKSSGYISNGSYTWSSFNNSSWTTFQNISIDQDQDFEIEATIKYVSGKTNSGIMLVWGRDSEGDNFNFNFTGGAQYWIGTYENKTYNASKSWTFTSSLYKKSYNKLTVRKIGNNYYYFINEKHVYTESFRPFFGDRVGFLVPNNSTIKINDLTVSYLYQDSNEEDPTAGYASFKF